jgi:predicted membrane protein
MQLEPPKTTNTRRIALFSVMAALCIVIQILPRPPGLEFTSLLTFIAGVVFGPIFGVSLATIVMMVNAFLSPYGFASLNLPFQIVGMSLIGAIGGFYKMEDDGTARFVAETAVLGAFLTIIYHLITNVGFALYLVLFLSSVSFVEALAIAQVSGVFFTIVYVATNTLLFGVGTVPIVSSMRKILRR